MYGLGLRKGLGLELGKTYGLGLGLGLEMKIVSSMCELKAKGLGLEKITCMG